MSKLQKFLRLRINFAYTLSLVLALLLFFSLIFIDNQLTLNKKQSDILDVQRMQDGHQLTNLRHDLFLIQTELLRFSMNDTEMAYAIDHDTKVYCESLQAVVNRGDKIITMFGSLPDYDPKQVGLWKALAKGRYIKACGAPFSEKAVLGDTTDASQEVAVDEYQVWQSDMVMAELVGGYALERRLADASPVERNGWEQGLEEGYAVATGDLRVENILNPNGSASWIGYWEAGYSAGQLRACVEQKSLCTDITSLLVPLILE